MSEAVFSIGSNLGDRLANLQVAVDTFRPWLTAISPVYETPPWGPVPQDPYLNAVLLASDLDTFAHDWLERVKLAESSAGRTRGVRWGPRTLDVDVIDVDGFVDDDPELTLPHPRAAQRAFVLIPWLACDPEARLGGAPLSTLIAALDPAEVQGVVPRPDLALL